MKSYLQGAEWRVRYNLKLLTCPGESLHNDYTQWVVVRDLTNRRYMFRTYDNQQVRCVDLTKLDLTIGAKKIIIPIEGGTEFVDITDQHNK